MPSWLLIGGCLDGGGLFSEWDIKQCNRKHARKKKDFTKQRGRWEIMLVEACWASFRAPVTSYKSLYGDTPEQGAPSGTGTFTFLLEWDLSPGRSSKCTFQSFDLTTLLGWQWSTGPEVIFWVSGLSLLKSPVCWEYGTYTVRLCVCTYAVSLRPADGISRERKSPAWLFLNTNTVCLTRLHGHRSVPLSL